MASVSLEKKLLYQTESKAKITGMFSEKSSLRKCKSISCAPRSNSSKLS